MDIYLGIYSLLFLGSYILWIVSSRKEKVNLTKLASAAMFFAVLLIIFRIFEIQTDFGLILGFFTLFSFLSIFVGILLGYRELIKESTSYFLILLVIFCIRSFWYEPYQIPSRSMVPGLQVGDFVLVNKHSYGLKFPGYYFPITKTIKPKRGDVAVFMAPHTLCKAKPEEVRPDLGDIPINESQTFISSFNTLQKTKCTNFGTKYVKRIIGVPGDSILLKGYDLYINGEKIDSVIETSNHPEYFYREKIGSKEFIARRTGTEESNSFEWRVPEDRYLVIGDNRDNSLDSRAWGYVSIDHLVGTADYIWMSWTSFSELPNFRRNQRIK
tara:strand:- start:1328 stop:2308 length:981 start_codon:yes stop_codon:yes gene_type:complete